MSIEFKPSDVIEAITDDVAMGELGQKATTFALSRVDCETVLLDYCDLERFRLG